MHNFEIIRIFFVLSLFQVDLGEVMESIFE